MEDAFRDKEEFSLDVEPIPIDVQLDSFKFLKMNSTNMFRLDAINQTLNAYRVEADQKGQKQLREVWSLKKQLGEIIRVQEIMDVNDKWVLLKVSVEEETLESLIVDAETGLKHQYFLSHKDADIKLQGDFLTTLRLEENGLSQIQVDYIPHKTTLHLFKLSEDLMDKKGEIKGIEILDDEIRIAFGYGEEAKIIPLPLKKSENGQTSE